MRYRVLPYRAGSKSASSLSEALGGRALRLQGSTFNPRRDDVIINWGNSDEQNLNRFRGNARLLNGQTAVASNKLSFFRAVSAAGEGDIVPDFWTDPRFIPDDAFPIVCRTVLAGHSGEGIVIANTRVELVRAPLYVKYQRKTAEFRIHVGQRLHGERGVQIISEQRKVRRADVAEPNWQVRNHQNGFVYQRHGIVIPDVVRDLAQRALRCTSLDFGAVDVVYHEPSGRAYVLEVNTAPGLEGQTVTDYANYIRSI